MKRSTFTRCLALALLFLAAAGKVSAHGPAAEPTKTEGPRNWGELGMAWALEPLILIPLLVSAWLYLRGLRRLWRTAGWGRGVPTTDAACFACGWLTLAVALVSPLHPWGNVLFS